MTTATKANPAAGERGRLVVVLATVAINVAAVSLLPFAPWSDWRTGAVLNVFDNLLLIGFVLLRRDRLLARFMAPNCITGP